MSACSNFVIGIYTQKENVKKKIGEFCFFVNAKLTFGMAFKIKINTHGHTRMR